MSNMTTSELLSNEVNGSKMAWTTPVVERVEISALTETGTGMGNDGTGGNMGGTAAS